jgi:hypothetical protein
MGPRNEAAAARIPVGLLNFALGRVVAGAWQSAPTRGGDIDVDQAQAPEGGAYLVRGRTVGRSSRRAHDDLPSGMALFQVRDCCRNFGERITPVDVGAHFAGLNQLRKELQICGGYVRRHLGEVPAAAQRNADQLRNAGEPNDGGLAALGERTFEIAHR